MHSDTFNCAFPLMLVYFPLISVHLYSVIANVAIVICTCICILLFYLQCKTAKLRIKNFVDFVSFRTQLQ